MYCSIGSLNKCCRYIILIRQYRNKRPFVYIFRPVFCTLVLLFIHFMLKIKIRKGRFKNGRDQNIFFGNNI